MMLRVDGNGLSIIFTSIRPPLDISTLQHFVDLLLARLAHVSVSHTRNFQSHDTVNLHTSFMARRGASILLSPFENLTNGTTTVIGEHGLQRNGKISREKKLLKVVIYKKKIKEKILVAFLFFNEDGRECGGESESQAAARKKTGK